MRDKILQVWVAALRHIDNFIHALLALTIVAMIVVVSAIGGRGAPKALQIDVEGLRITAIVHRIAPPRVADSAWIAMGACSGVAPVGHLDDVIWFSAVPSSLDVPSGHLWGAWLPPDTIVLDARMTERGWLVAHELLHHLTGGLPNIRDAHPLFPFVFPCRVMPFQNGIGSVMPQGWRMQ